MELQKAHSAELKLRLMDINDEVRALRDEASKISAELVSRTVPKYDNGQILQRMNEFGAKKNIRIIDAIPTADGWKYKCEQAGVLTNVKTYFIEESHLHDIGLKDKDFYTTSPKHEFHRKPKRQKKGGQETKSVKIDAATQDKINALLNI